MDKKGFVGKIKSDIVARVKHNKTSVEKLAAGFAITDKSLVKELTELAIVLRARELAHQAKSPHACFNDIVDLYHAQVNLSHRTSESMLLQQYSTPAPIGYLAGMFCGINQPGHYFEPSAGNGLLTVAANPKNFHVNEIGENRLANLKTQGFGKVSSRDASLPFPFSEKFDAVITNPPFGALDKPVNIDGFPIAVLDHLMCIYALDKMKNTGRAAMIIGGHTTWDDKGRIQAGKNRIFFSYLYKHYNVLEVLNIDGKKLYSRQGTAFNVRLILLDGRKASPSGVPPLRDPQRDVVIADFEELYQRASPYLYTERAANTFDAEAEALTLELELVKT